MSDFDIEFRAYYHNEFKNLCGYLSSEEMDGIGGFYYHYGVDCPDDHTLEQYTGFKDKHGNKIFYNDIYNSIIGPNLVDRLTVAHWLIEEDKMNNPLRDVQILGNKIENSELLEEE